jgi:hypothetical protein
MVPAMVALTHPDAQLTGGPFETGHLTSMNPKHVPQFRLCPSCGRNMRAIHESEIYECKPCRVFVTERD